MAKGKYAKGKGFNIKPLVVLLVAILVIGGSIGGTLAWLTDHTDPVVNTFTVGNVDIELNEDKVDFKMTPGVKIDKDPKVTVKKGSEACWVFVKVEESANLNRFITYKIAGGWTELTGKDGVYYREQDAIADTGTDVVYSVLAEDKVDVKDTVTEDMMDSLDKDPAQKPTLTFTAYAIQKAGFADAAAAWEEVSK